MHTMDVKLTQKIEYGIEALLQFLEVHVSKVARRKSFEFTFDERVTTRLKKYPDVVCCQKWATVKIRF